MPSCSGGRSDGRSADTLAGRSGKGYDPAVVTVLVSEGEHWLAESDDDLCARVLDAEPAPVITIAPHELDAALGAIAEFVDLKSPWLRTHSTGVSDLAASASRAPWDSPTTTPTRSDAPHSSTTSGGSVCRRASGTAPVPSPPSSGSAAACTPTSPSVSYALRSMLEPLADVASRHHERGGWQRLPPRNAKPASSTFLLDCSLLLTTYHAMTEARPHRPALVADDAANAAASRRGQRPVRPNRGRCCARCCGPRRPRPPAPSIRRDSPNARSKSYASSRRARRTNRSPSLSASRRRQSAPTSAHLREGRRHDTIDERRVQRRARPPGSSGTSCPNVLELEHADEYPTEMVEQMREFGLFGATIPTEYGGLGLSTVDLRRDRRRRSPRCGCRSPAS